MMKHKIGWLNRPGTTGETWNPITGCTKISEGCAHCYAERMSKRLAGRFGYPADEPFRVTVHEDKLDAPLKWRKPRTVFVCSMGDLFHEDVDFSNIAAIWSVMERTPQHTYMVLTKRPERMLEFVLDFSAWESPSGETGYSIPDNVWLGVTAENQQRADERIPLLLQCPAAVRFVSIEPMLAPVKLKSWLEEYRWHGDVGRIVTALDWIIVGAETGPGARTMRLQDAYDVKRQCEAAGVPFFFKSAGKNIAIPNDLMVRQYPEGMVQ